MARKTAKFERIPGHPLRKSGNLLYRRLKVDGVDKWMMQGLIRGFTMYNMGTILTIDGELSQLRKSLKKISGLEVGEKKSIGGGGTAYVLRVDDVVECKDKKCRARFNYSDVSDGRCGFCGGELGSPKQRFRINKRCNGSLFNTEACLYELEGMFESAIAEGDLEIKPEEGLT